MRMTTTKKRAAKDRMKANVKVLLKGYADTDASAEIATAIEVMRLSKEARREEVAKLLQPGAYHRLPS